MNKQSDWEVVKDFYVTTFNVSDSLVELVANSEILHMCVTGASNTSISETLDVDVQDVMSVIKAIYDFDGWVDDLGLNPYKIFEHLRNTGSYQYKDFKDAVSEYSSEEDEVKNMFRSCRTYEKIKINIDNNWI